MLLPGIGVMNWKEPQDRIPWGTLVQFGVGISLGSALLSTQAASWLAGVIVAGFGLQTLPALMILATLAMLLIIIHLGFANENACICQAFFLSRQSQHDIRRLLRI